jgi:molybdopterin molybdotransferase
VTESTDAVLRKAGESAAGHLMTAPLQPRTAVRISTGAVLPEGADAVVAQEDVDDLGESIRIRTAEVGGFSPGTYVRKAGSDIEQDELLLEEGTLLGHGDVAMLASAGHAKIPVHRRPEVAVLCTGDELVPVGKNPAPGQVVGTNGMMLEGQVREAGGIPISLGNVGDDLSSLRARLERGLETDVIVTSGGISVGDHDLVHDALMDLGCTLSFHGVRLRPGKPTAFVTRGQTLGFALPGNPASSFVTFELFVRPVLRRMLGVRGDTTRPRRTVELDAAVRGAGRRAHYVRGVVSGGRATPLTHQVSGDLRSISQANALLVVPPEVPHMPAGAKIEALILDPP